MIIFRHMSKLLLFELFDRDYGSENHFPKPPPSSPARQLTAPPVGATACPATPPSRAKGQTVRGVSPARVKGTQLPSKAPPSHQHPYATKSQEHHRSGLSLTFRSLNLWPYNAPVKKARTGRMPLPALSRSVCFSFFWAKPGPILGTLQCSRKAWSSWCSPLFWRSAPPKPYQRS